MREIQKNVPVPKTIRPNKAPRRKYPFDTMEVGDMFFEPNRKTNTLITYVSVVGKRLGRTFTTRLCYMVDTPDGWEMCEKDDEGAVLGIGVWRTE